MSVIEAREFVHLHVHSEFSLLDGAGRLKEIIKKAKELGMTSLALTDHGVMYGALSFYRNCLAEGLKPILGVEAYVTDEQYHLVLLAETNEGYQNLLKLTSKAHLEGIHDKPRLRKEWLHQYSNGLICLSAGLAGEIQQALLHNRYEEARHIALEHLQIFGEGNYFLEIQDHGLPEQKKINAGLIRISQEFHIPLVVTNDVHYIAREDALAHDCLLCIGTGQKIQDEERLRFPNDQFYLKNQEEMQRLFPHLPEAYLNTGRIAERCRVQLSLGQEILPAFPIPQGTTALEYLREQCWVGVEQRYRQITEEIERRLEYELEVIGQMGYADYFLIIWDLVSFAHRQGILVGPGRGSAAGSLVAYVLKITNIDPLAYNLLFERFLNPERVSMPDIDIDFSDQRRNEVIHYVVAKYGADHVAQIITFGTLTAKAAIRDVGRVLDIPLAVIDQVAKLIPSGPQVTLEQAWTSSSSLREMASKNAQIAHLLDIAKQLEGVARHHSTHAAGIVISRDPLTNYVPLQAGQEGIPLTQFPMEDLEVLGLLKMDFLGLRNLTLLEEIVSLINQSKTNQAPFSLEQIPLDDPQTFQMLGTGETTGVFQLESEGMRQVLKRLRPSNFEDLIAVLALYRPGPMQNIPLFIDAKHGKTAVAYPHPDLEPILKETYGIIVYQEQIMQIASKMAGFSLGEADLLRRAVSKKKREILEQERTHFLQGCLDQGYPAEVAEHVYDLIVRFADYGFNRSHSAAYAVIAYQLAYLKCHYPVAFLASLLSAVMGSQEKVAEYLALAKKQGIVVLPPSVQASSAGFVLEENQIRFGLSVIKYVGIPAIQEILRARRAGSFRNLLDFCQRVNLRMLNRRVLESLILAGACDDLGMHRAQALANLDKVLDMAEQAQGLRASDQLFFFAEELPDDYQWLDVPAFSAKTQLTYEKEVLGFYLSGHPLDPYRELAQRYQAHPLASFSVFSGTFFRTIGSINRVRKIRTKKGEAMAFVQLEDQGVELDTVFFPAVYKEAFSLLEDAQLVLIEGKLEQREKGKQLIAQKVFDLTSLSEPEMQHLFIKIAQKNQQFPKLEALRHLLLRYKGLTPVYLYYEQKRKTVLLDQEYHVQLHPQLIKEIEVVLDERNCAIIK